MASLSPANIDEKAELMYPLEGIQRNSIKYLKKRGIITFKPDDGAIMIITLSLITGVQIRPIMGDKEKSILTVFGQQGSPIEKCTLFNQTAKMILDIITTYFHIEEL